MVQDFARRYTAAWCSQNAASVAAFFSPDGSLTINGLPSVGRIAITQAAQDFMTAFPDMVVTMEDIFSVGDRFIYKWKLTGINIGSAGKTRKVSISGFEEWWFGSDSWVCKSLGHFDQQDYQRQLA